MKNVFASYPVLEDDLSAVRKVIREQSYSTNAALSSGLEDATASGKLLRPAFLLLAGHLGKFDPEKHTALAAAVEMLHIATLIHDDIVDESSYRRGKPALHVTQGKHGAVLMGDFLFSRCFKIASRHGKMENARLLSSAVGRICESEIEDSAGLIPSRRAYLRKTAGKTAVLFTLSCFVGAEEAGCSRRICDSMRRAGYNIGMGFQIIDDILDCAGNAEELGKPIGNDLRAGIITLPVVLALQNAGPRMSGLLSSFAAGNVPIETVLDAVRETGGLEGAKTHALLYTRRAVDALSALPKSWAKDALLDLAESLLLRTF